MRRTAALIPEARRRPVRRMSRDLLEVRAIGFFLFRSLVCKCLTPL